MSAYNDNVIAEFRANSGTTEAFGDALLLLHTTGHVTGAERVHPVRTVVIDGDWYVAGSAAGRAKDPAWATNLRAHPDAVVESPEGTFDVRAELVEGDDRPALWAAFTEEAPQFVDYQTKADEHGRVIPLFRLVRR